jgi:uncharacterized alpha-E superfamily protein
MLSRVANSLYWMSRYLERVEDLARMVEVNRYDALESDRLDTSSFDELWRPLLYATCTEDAFNAQKPSSGEPLDVSWFITFSDALPDSIRGCLIAARENARMVRDQISEDIWLELNRFHLFIRSQQAEDLWHEQPDAFYRRTINFCMLLAGLINATLSRDEGWQFIQVGKFLERADKTTRILDMISFHRDPDRARLLSALRSCSGLSAYRDEFRGELSLLNVASFLLFSETFPRSVRFCFRALDDHLHRISGFPGGTYSNEAERLTGSNLARLNFSDIHSVGRDGLHDFIDNLQQHFNDIGQSFFETYVLLPSEIQNLSGQGMAQWQWQQQQQQQQ